MREGATLDYIERMRNHMVYYLRRGLFDIAKIQAIAVLITLMLGESILRFLGILNVLFYLDQRRAVLLLTGLLGLWILNRKLEALEYQTFMLQ